MNAPIFSNKILDYFLEPYSKEKVNKTAFKMNFFLNSSMISFLFIIFSIISYHLFEDTIPQSLSMTFIFCFSLLTAYLFYLSMKVVDSVVYMFPVSPNIILKKYVDLDLVNSTDETKKFYDKIMNERDMYVFEYYLIKDYVNLKKHLK